ncbi:FapA family protein [Bacillus tianshenii]|nr:FapA family protein [Bacillus tianshenii]
MNKSITSKGKTVDEAVDNGLRELGVSREEVDVEVIEEGKARFLHFASKGAVVKLTQKKQMAHTFQFQREEHQSELDEPTSVAWVEDGKILWQHDGKTSPQIVIPPEIDIYKNDTLVNDTKLSLHDGDLVRYESGKVNEETKFEIYLNEQKTKAFLKVMPGFECMYALKKMEPSRVLKLEITEIKKPYLTLTEQMIQSAIEEEGIVFGIKREMFKQACATQDEGEFLIADGIDPVQGTNGWLEYKVKINESTEMKEREDGTIDFRDTRHIPTVKEQELIAVIHPPKKGTSGKAVTGEEVPPQPVKAIKVQQGEGVEIVESSGEVFAKVAGRPSIENRLRSILVEVLPKLEHRGDVNIESGNLNFYGDIEVYGNVDENMVITANRDLVVRGTTSKSELTAGRNMVLHGNVIGTKVVCGKRQQVMASQAETLEAINQELRHFDLAVEQLLKNPAFQSGSFENTGISAVAKLLINNKFAHLVEIVKEFSKGIQNEEELFSPKWKEVADRLTQAFVHKKEEHLKEIQDLYQFIEDIELLYEAATTPPEEKMSVILPTALNSDIFCAGDVTVTDQGCYNTSIHAIGKIKINGFLRGGSVFASERAEIHEAGSKGGVPTRITVPKDGAIYMHQVMADTTIRIGHQSFKFTKKQQNIHARLDEDGRITLA